MVRKVNKTNKVSKVVKPVPEQNKLQFTPTKEKIAEMKPVNIFEGYSYEKAHARFVRADKKRTAKLIKKGYKIED